MNSLLILAVILSGNSSNLPCSACMSFIDNPYGGTLVADGGALGQLNIVGPPPVNQSFGGKICLDPTCTNWESEIWDETHYDLVYGFGQSDGGGNEDLEIWFLGPNGQGETTFFGSYGNVLGAPLEVKGSAAGAFFCMAQVQDIPTMQGLSASQCVQNDDGGWTLQANNSTTILDYDSATKTTIVNTLPSGNGQLAYNFDPIVSWGNNLTNGSDVLFGVPNSDGLVNVRFTGAHFQASTACPADFQPDYCNSYEMDGAWYPDAGGSPPGPTFEWGQLTADDAGLHGINRDGGNYWEAYAGDTPDYCGGSSYCGPQLWSVDFQGNWTIDAGVTARAISDPTNGYTVDMHKLIDWALDAGGLH